MTLSLHCLLPGTVTCFASNRSVCCGLHSDYSFCLQTVAKVLCLVTSKHQERLAIITEIMIIIKIALILGSKTGLMFHCVPDYVAVERIVEPKAASHLYFLIFVPIPTIPVILVSLLFNLKSFLAVVTSHCHVSHN
jgi:hypothetical protein